jgi:hypothetical protein
LTTFVKPPVTASPAHSFTTFAIRRCCASYANSSFKRFGAVVGTKPAATEQKLTAKLRLTFELIGGRTGIAFLPTCLRGFGRLARVDWLLFSSPFFLLEQALLTRAADCDWFRP